MRVCTKSIDERALVQTVDFFTPIVDDPRVFGRIAAANALSDVYAMGGRPLTALAIAAFPKDADRAILADIFGGGLDTLREAGVALLGGHTVQDTEIKFGYAITGEVDPARRSGPTPARAPATCSCSRSRSAPASSRRRSSFERAPARAVDAAVASMTTLNRAAAEALARLPPGTVHACTDVTGFGLIGHAMEMAAASALHARDRRRRGAAAGGRPRLVDGNVPGGGRTNAQHFGTSTRGRGRRARPTCVQLFYDPQTSGGLLISLAATDMSEALDVLRSAGSCRDEHWSSDRNHQDQP